MCTELSPCLVVDEHDEEDEAHENDTQTHGDEHGAEAKRALKVDAERNENAVGAERTVKPTEAESKADEYPRDEAEDRTVEYPFGEDAAQTAEEKDAVGKHGE